MITKRPGPRSQWNGVAGRLVIMHREASRAVFKASERLGREPPVRRVAPFGASFFLQSGRATRREPQQCHHCRGIKQDGSGFPLYTLHRTLLDRQVEAAMPTIYRHETQGLNVNENVDEETAECPRVNSPEITGN